LTTRILSVGSVEDEMFDLDDATDSISSIRMNRMHFGSEAISRIGVGFGGLKNYLIDTKSA